MLSEGGSKALKKKRKEKNVLMTKATHCSSSPTLKVVVQRLARWVLGWGCPASGPV